jgi:serine/threonine protein kinase
MENRGKALIHLASYNFDIVTPGSDDVLYKVGNPIPLSYPYDPFLVEQQLGAAIQAMADLGYLHRDVKLDNIVLDEKGMLSFIDFERVAKAGVVKKKSKWDGDVFPRSTAITNGDIFIDIPGDGFCYNGSNDCDKYQAALALLNLGGRFELTGDYEYDQESNAPLVTQWKKLLGATTVSAKKIYKKLEEMFLNYRKTAQDLNLPALFCTPGTIGAMDTAA